MTTFKLDEDTVEIKVTMAFSRKRTTDPIETLHAFQKLLNKIEGVETFLVDSIEEENFCLFENNGAYGIFKKEIGRKGVWREVKWGDYRKDVEEKAAAKESPEVSA